MGACCSTSIVEENDEPGLPSGPQPVLLGASSIEMMEGSVVRGEDVELDVQPPPVVELAKGKATEAKQSNGATEESRTHEVATLSIANMEAVPVTPPEDQVLSPTVATAAAPEELAAPSATHEPAGLHVAQERTSGRLASGLLSIMARPLVASLLVEKEVKREGGPLGGVPEEWDAFNSAELAVLRQVKAWMSDTPGLFERASADTLACYVRGYAPLVNWVDHVYARMHVMLKWRMEESIDTVRAWRRRCVRGAATARAIAAPSALSSSLTLRHMRVRGRHAAGSHQRRMGSSGAGEAVRPGAAVRADRPR